MREDRCALEPLPELDRDRGGCPLAGVVERLRLLLDHPAQEGEVEVRLVAGRRQHSSDGPGDCADSGADGGELPPGVS